MPEPSSTELKHLTLDCFVYDLHNGLGETEQDIEERRIKFWQRLYPKGDFPAKDKSDFLEQVRQRETQDSNYIELLDQRYLPLPKQENGYFYPVLLGDTYLTLIDSSGEMCWRGQPQPIKNLQSIWQSIEAHLPHPGEIGQSWLIWGQLTTEVKDKDKVLAIAKECYEALKLDASWPPTTPQSSHWHGATLFEQWHSNYHVLIALFPDDHPNSTTIASTLQRHLSHLLCYRHKILWAYQQSRQLITKLKTSSGEIQDLIDRLDKHLKTSPIPLKALQTDLAEAVNLFASYSKQLSYLEEQQHTIEINLDNYGNRLTQMERDDPSADLQLFHEFETYAREKYLKQVESDYRGLSPGLRLLENTISTISGISQLEQSKRDRQLNKTVAIAGVWVGTASATASLITPVTTQILQGLSSSSQENSKPPSSPNVVTTFSLSLLLSLVIGLGIGSLVAWFWKIFKPFR